MIRVVFETSDYVVADKPSGLATVPLKGEEGETLLSSLSLRYPEILSVHGRQPWEGGVIHRLDTPTEGLVLVARTQEAFDFFLSEQLAGRIQKTYRALLSPTKSPLPGFEPFPYPSFSPDATVSIGSWFRAFGVGAKSVRPVYANERLKKGPFYTTECRKESEKTVLCTLSRGFRHQVRVHLAWSGHPLLGDELYGGQRDIHFGLSAIALSFRDPHTHQHCVIER